MLLEWILFPLGFVFLVKGADILVDGASNLARRWNVSALVIGLTVVSFGTSAPELAVNLSASFAGSSDIAIGNIIGSNIANIFLVLGITALIQPLVVQSSTVWKEIPFSILAMILVGIYANDALIDGSDHSVIGRSDGLSLLAFFIVFMYYTFNLAKRGEKVPVLEELNEFEENADGVESGLENKKNVSALRSFIYVIFGLVMLIFGGEWIVNGAVLIAREFGLSEAFIALSIVAIGTSLPEVAASVAAALKGKVDIAIGNAIGSNIFNVFLVLGISSTILPLPFSKEANFDILIAAFASVLLFFFLLIGKKKMLERFEGIIFLLMYVVYIGYRMTM